MAHPKHVHDNNDEPARFGDPAHPYDEDLIRPLVICRLNIPADRDTHSMALADLRCLRGDDAPNSALVRKCVYAQHYMPDGSRAYATQQSIALLWEGAGMYMLAFPFWVSNLSLWEHLVAQLPPHAVRGGEERPFYCPWKPSVFGRVPRVYDADRVEYIHDPMHMPKRRGAPFNKVSMLMARSNHLESDAIDDLFDICKRTLVRTEDIYVHKRNIPSWKKRDLPDPDDEMPEEDVARHVEAIERIPPGPYPDMYFSPSQFARDYWNMRMLPLDALRNWISHFLFIVGETVFQVTAGGNIVPFCGLANFDKMPLVVYGSERGEKRHKICIAKDIRDVLPLYSGFDMIPNAPRISHGKVNMWQGWNIDPSDLLEYDEPVIQIPRFRRFLAILCERLFNSDIDLFYHGLCYLRHAYLFPHECPARMLVLAGVHGIGKGCLFDHLFGKHIFKNHFLSVNKAERLTQQFNALTVHSAFIHLDDVHLTTDQYQDLKSMITQTSGSIELKGSNRVKVDHLVHHMVMSCNDIKFAVDMTERRFMIVPTGDMLQNHLRIHNYDMWSERNTEFYDMCTSERAGYASFLSNALCSFLVNDLDSAQYDERHAPPMTDLLRKAMIRSLPQHLSIWMRFLTQGYSLTEDRAGNPERCVWDAKGWCTYMPYYSFRDLVHGQKRKIEEDWFEDFGIETEYEVFDGRKVQMIRLPTLVKAREYAIRKYPTLTFDDNRKQPISVWSLDEEDFGLSYDPTLFSLEPMEHFVDELARRKYLKNK